MKFFKDIFKGIEYCEYVSSGFVLFCAYVYNLWWSGMVVCGKGMLECHSQKEEKKLKKFQVLICELWIFVISYNVYNLW